MLKCWYSKLIFHKRQVLYENRASMLRRLATSRVTPIFWAECIRIKLSKAVSACQWRKAPAFIFFAAAKIKSIQPFRGVSMSVHSAVEPGTLWAFVDGWIKDSVTSCLRALSVQLQTRSSDGRQRLWSRFDQHAASIVSTVKRDCKPTACMAHILAAATVWTQPLTI